MHTYLFCLHCSSRHSTLERQPCHYAGKIVIKRRRIEDLYEGYIVWRQRGQVVSVSDLQSSNPSFESRSDHYLDLFLGSPEFKSSARLVHVQVINSQLVCLWPVGILDNVMFNLKYLFHLFAWPR